MNAKNLSSPGLSQERASKLLPLPLVPFERYMLADDRPSHPMTFAIVVELDGVMDRGALESAVADATVRHPLVAAKLKRLDGTICWVPAGSPPKVKWQQVEVLPHLRVDHAMDLFRDPGMHLCVAVDERATKLTFLFHHAVCDGIGGLRFIGDVLALYGQKMVAGSDQPALLSIDLERLKTRGTFNLKLPAPVTPWQAIRSMVSETWCELRHRPVVLHTPCRRALVPRDPAVACPVLAIDQDVFRRYSKAALTVGATANDVLLRDLFVTIRKWNEQQGASSRRGWIRVTVPTSLRSRGETRMPATNVLGYALMGRPVQACDGSSDFLQRLVADMEAVRKWGIGSFFVTGLGIVDRVPGLLKTTCHFSRRFSTAVLSNVGDPVRRLRCRLPQHDGTFIVGNTTLKNIYGVAPVRPGTRVAIVATSHAGALTLAMRFDPEWLDERDAEAFLSKYRDQILQSTEPGPNP